MRHAFVLRPLGSHFANVTNCDPTILLTRCRISAAGFEKPILEGGAALFKTYNVWFIMAGEAQAHV